MVVWIASTRNTVLQTKIFHESYGFGRSFFYFKAVTEQVVDVAIAFEKMYLRIMLYNV